MLIATAGHVDHGKTTLVNALTGVDTDRLPEEKSRGLTIDLGFAYAAGPDGQRFGFVDVPGHEKFVRNMAAGVGAIDVALLVVAADDGVMPQTREHVAILDLFGVSHCVVAVTRSDLVGEPEIARVSEDVESLLKGTSLQGAQAIPVSAPTGLGLDALRQTLGDISGRIVDDASQQRFRLSIDRSFTVKGAGTVVTGAIFSGAVAVGDSVRLLPSGRETRVRSLHADGMETERAHSGQRAALNITGIETAEAPRGAWIVDEAIDVVSGCVDVAIRVLDTEPRSLRHWTPVHVHAGAGSTTGRIALYDVRSLDPGESGYGQLVLDQPQHLLFNDRFVIRDQTASRTVGGGRVVDPFASRHRRFRKDRQGVLKALDTSDSIAALNAALSLTPSGISEAAFAQTRNLRDESLNQIVEASNATRIVDAAGETRLLDRESLASMRQKILAAITQHHEEQPESIGVDPEALYKLIGASGDLFEAALGELLKDQGIERAGVRLKVRGHAARLSEDDQALLDKILALVTPDMTKPPPLSELATNLGVDRTDLSARVSPLARAGHIVRVAENRVFHPQALDKLAEMARVLAEEHGKKGFDAKAFRDRTGIGRNISIDVLEYFDSAGLTRRLADRRTFRR